MGSSWRIGLNRVNQQDKSSLKYGRIMDGSSSGMAGTVAGGVAAARLGYRPAGATRHEHRQYALSAGLANWLYYTTLFSSKIPLRCREVWTSRMAYFVAERSSDAVEESMLKRALLHPDGEWLRSDGHGPAAQQFIYKWTDEQGKLKYSELPPPTGVKYEMVRKPAGATPGTEAA